ncbi:protein Atg16l2-like isoform X2 [Synchiropus splendidus]|uniref:protein Atg16l2-like isoform X2 n=1 Tax=Synchiropus splendidus TaxID=270530 RepID=UPI00237E1DDB|nr:protein Atg16l2-like isoform X2 [Synchiropus splendidus]
MANAVVAAEASVPVPAPHMTPTWRERGAGAWRSHVVHQLKLRDAAQRDTFRDLIRFYTGLLERSALTNGRASSWRASAQSSASSLLVQKQQLTKTTGDLAFQVVQMQRSVRSKERLVEEQRDRLQRQQLQLDAAAASRLQLQRRVHLLQQLNLSLKSQYDVLLQCRRQTESSLQQQKVRAAPPLQHVGGDPPARSPGSQLFAGPMPQSPGPVAEPDHPCLVRSASARSSRFLLTLRELFRKRRGHSLSSLDQDLWRPLPGGLARVPARALHVLEAHEQGINAVRFCAGSAMLATGGTDRVVRVWEVSAGWLSHRRTLEGSTDGITCVDFDPAGWRVLAASYDKSALLWRLDDSAPQLTLTGHSRKVTSARFSSLHQVATGSADGTVRLWDLHRAACVQVADAASCCSDLLCCDRSFISGHFDGRVRVWDHRMSTVAQQFPALGKVTSLDVTPDHRQLLSCCRDDCLQLTDLRMQKPSSACFRAEGFSCGGDCTRAVLSPDGRFAAAGSADGAVYVWSVSRGGLETRLPDGHRSAVNAVSWSVSGEFVVSVDKSRQAVLWSHV